MRIRHGLAAALGLLLALVLASPASAAVNAFFSMGTLEIQMTASGDSARVFVDGTTLRVAEDSTISGGPATTANTDIIRFEDFSGTSGNTTAVVDHSGGPFAPGATSEGSTSDEIEFAFDMVGGHDVVRVILAPAGQQVAVGNTGMNFNPLEPTPPAKDDDVVGDLASVEAIELQGGPGDDTITGSSTGAGVDTATKPLTITGGGGDDDLTGGDGNDQINSQDGDNNDVISCRGGDADIATADFLDAVGTDCETINRPTTGGGGGTGGGTGGGGGTPPPTGTTAPPNGRLAPGRLAFRRGSIGVPVTCPAASAAPCRGTVTIRRRGRILGRRSYTAAPGRRVVVRVRLNAAGVRLFRRRSRVRVVVRITSVGGSPQQRSVLVRSPGAR